MSAASSALAGCSPGAGPASGTTPPAGGAAFARWLLPLGAALALTPWLSIGVSLVLGAALGLTVGNPWPALTRKAAHKLLVLAVIGLGGGADLAVVARVGAHGVVTTAVSIALCLGLGLWLARRLRVPRDAGLLIAVGTAICGGSAIAAVAPILRARDHEVSLALATVFLLNGAALFLFPLIGHHAGLTPSEFGTWAALAIHDTSSVVGAALAYGGGAAAIATTLKLTRALWIVPLALGLGAVVARRRPLGAGEGKRALPRPWFILGFVVASALVTWVPALRPAGALLATAARRAMALSLFFVGAGLTRATLRAVGVRPLVQGVLLWAAMAGSTLAILLASR